MFNTNDLDDFNVDFEDESLFSGNNVVSFDLNNQSDSSASKIVSSQYVLRTTKQPNNDINKDVSNVNIENPKNSGNRIVTSSDFLNNLLNESGSSHTEKRKLESVIPEKNLKNKIAQQRKFPGPAGLLPDKPIKDLKNVSLILDPELDELEGEKESVILYSQTSASIFEEPPYLKLLSDFDMNKAESPLHKYTIEWVKKKVVTKMFIGKKIPFLALVLQQLDHSTPDPVVTFRDPTGEIDGILHRDAWNDMGHKFHPGAALALRQVGVLSISRQQVYLNITMNNILSIYTALDDSQDAEKNCINEMSSYDLLKSIDDWQAQEQAQSSTETPERNNASNNSLFSCINSHNSPNLLKRKLNQSTPIKKPNLVTNKSEPITKKVSPKCDFDISMDDINFDEFSDEKTLEKDPNTSSSVINFKPPDSKTKEKRLETDLRTITAGIKFAPCDNRPAFLEPNKEINNSVLKPKPKPNPIFSQVLTQEESQMVEEVLDGIDFDEF